MTNKQAKHFLKEFLGDKPNFREDRPGQDEEVYRQMDMLAKAIDLAIKALEGKDINVPSKDHIADISKKADTIYRQDAIDTIDSVFRHEVYSEADAIWNKAIEVASNKIKYDLPSAQPDWGKPVGDGRPLADSEVVPRLRDIQKQIGGSYAIDRAIEVLEGLQDAQPDAITLEWITKHLEWLDNCDNDFAQLAKVGIRAMVEIWKKDR